MLTLPDPHAGPPDPSISEKMWAAYWTDLEQQGGVTVPVRRGYPHNADILLSLLRYGNSIADFIRITPRPLLGYGNQGFPLEDALDALVRLTRILEPDCDSWTPPLPRDGRLLSFMWGNNLTGTTLAQINERHLPEPGSDAATTARCLIVDGWETDFGDLDWHECIARIFLRALDTANALHPANQ
jgi:hypothetical protein